ncbi:unnamed protein product [Rangifer tarandus platyrhynchus]|uniref:Uncharacterized protein n=1 Tax=Rangifer tarandus platyrhynchus TaxID=3082113 RepID=A0AC59YNV4_RANTA
MPSCKRRRLKHEGQPQKAARSTSLHGVRPSGLVCPRHPPQLPGPQGEGAKHAAQKLRQGRLSPDSARPALVHRLPPQGCRPGLFRTTRRSAAPGSPLGPAWPDPSPAAPGSALHQTTRVAAPQPSGPAQPSLQPAPLTSPSTPRRQHRARPPNLPTHPAASTQPPARPLTEQRQEHRSAAAAWPSRASTRMCRGGRGREPTRRGRFLIFDSWACEAPTLRSGQRDPSVPVTVSARLRGVCVACLAGRGLQGGPHKSNGG